MLPALSTVLFGRSQALSPAFRAATTRANVPYGYNAGNTDLMSETFHIARTRITRMKVVYSNWYIDTNNNTNTWAELGTGTTASLIVGYKKVGGSASQILFSGSSTGSVASGADIVSDEFAVDLQPGDVFSLRPQWHNTGGILYLPAKADATFGDRFEFTAVDKSISGTVANSLPGYAFFPTAILGFGTQRSAFLLGTSRTFGFNDTADGVTGDIGALARCLGPLAGYCNAGVPGDTAQRVVAALTKRALLANNYYTDVYVEHGVNDIARGVAQIEADLQTIYAAFPSKRVHGVTISPNTSGAWTLSDGTDQTNLAGTTLTTVNAYLLNTPAPLYATHDVANDHTMVGQPTKWKAPSYTDDGLHGLQAAYIASLTNKTLTI